jgi:hypothetical protein
MFSTLQLLVLSIIAPLAHSSLRVLYRAHHRKMIAFCRADGCLLLLIVVRSGSTGGESLEIFWAMPAITATSLCEYARKLASLFGHGPHSSN